MTTTRTRTTRIVAAVVMIIAGVACGASRSNQTAGSAASSLPATPATIAATTTAVGSSIIRRTTAEQVSKCLNDWVQLRVVASNSGVVYTYQLDNNARGCDNALRLVQIDEKAGASGEPVKLLALVVASFGDAAKRAVASVMSIGCTGKCDLTATSDPQALDLILPSGPGYPRLRAKIEHQIPGLLSSLDVDGVKVG